MTNTYTTVQGDTWDLISYNVFGTSSYMSDMIDANPAHRETVIFSAGVGLTVPDVSAVAISSKLPPWKQETVE